MHSVPLHWHQISWWQCRTQVLITIGYTKGLVTAFVTRLPEDYKNIIILTFHMRKLRPSNLEGVLISSTIFTIVDEKEIVNEVISK